MPKAPRTKLYAVKIGREGPKIYDTWEEAKQRISRFPGAVHKSFTSRSQAEEWLGVKREQTDNVLPHRDSIRTSQDGRSPGTAIVLDDESNGVNPSKLSTPTACGDVQRSAETPAPVEPEINLSPEQRHVFNMVKSGKSVFFTGAAGTGKSVLLRTIIQWCRGEGRKELAVTASTGIASVNIGGSTLHSWAGIGLGKEKAEHLVGKILGQDKYRRMKERQNREKLGLPLDDEDASSERDDKDDKPRVVERWRKVRVLIIDEISMIDGELFDKLEFIARVLKKNQKPFGGIQLVLCGDFCQLPPVGDRGSRAPPTFAFDATSWKSCVGNPVTLRKVFRQKEQKFVDMLNSMRFGQLDPETVQTFRGLSREVVYDDGLVPTELFPTRREVDLGNTTRLNKIQEPAHQYNAIDVPGFDERGQRISYEMMDKLLNNLIAQKSLTLKVGAQVMLIKNLVQGQLVNGSIGRVVSFSTAREALKNGAMLGVVESGGDRAKSVLDVDHKGKNGVPDVVREHIKSGRPWPVVKFGTGRDVLCVPAQFEINNAEGVIQARRDQVPLILAWALSIHKSQGQTLERVRVDLGRIFEKGQAYVALSRATSIERLQVMNFDPAKVTAHERVLEWMSQHGSIPKELARAMPMDDIDDELEFWANEIYM